MAMASWDTLMLCEDACDASDNFMLASAFQSTGLRLGSEGGLDCVKVYRVALGVWDALVPRKDANGASGNLCWGPFFNQPDHARSRCG